MTKLFAYSDLHLKPGQKNYPFHDFLDIVEHEKPDLVVGVGDNHETAWFDIVSIMTERHSAEIMERKKKIAANTEWWEMPGNHNPDVEAYENLIWPIRTTAPCVEVEGIRFEHGHRDDITAAWWNFWVKQPWVKEHLPWLYMRLFGSPREWKEKDQAKWSKLVALYYNLRFEQTAMDEKVNLIFGHTHQPYVKTMQNGIQVGNCGDFCDSYSFIEVTDSTMKLRRVR